MNKCIYLLTALLFTVMFSVGEVAARNFALYVGHLRGERSQWCNRLLTKGSRSFFGPSQSKRRRELE